MDQHDKAVNAAIKEAKRVEGIIVKSIRAMANEKEMPTDYGDDADEGNGTKGKKSGASSGSKYTPLDHNPSPPVAI